MVDKIDDVDPDVAEAEAALQKAEETHGQDHLMVSYALDNLVRILRSKRIRALDAVNMDARAKAIRKKHNAGPSDLNPRKAQEINDAIQIASQRQRADQSKRRAVATICVLGVVAIAGRMLLAPSDSERQMMQNVMKGFESVLPTTVAQQAITAGQDAVKDAQSANDMHNKQVDEYLGND